MTPAERLQLMDSLAGYESRPDEISVTIPWTPHAKQRPRLGRGRRAYTPAATHRAEAAVRDAYREAVDHTPFDVPVAVLVAMEAERLHLTIRPCDDYEHRRLRGDIDNYAKTVLDALNGTAWVDDKHIRSLGAIKL